MTTVIVQRQVFAIQAAASSASVVAPAGGISLTDPPYLGLEAYTASSAQTWGDTATTIELTTAGVADAGLTLASSEVTASAAGRFNATAEITLDIAVGDPPATADVWLEIGGVEVPGTRRPAFLDASRGPARVETTLHADLLAGQAIRVRSARILGTSSILLQSASLSIERLAIP